MAHVLRSLIILIGPLAVWIVPVAGLLVHAGHGDTPVNRTLLKHLKNVGLPLNVSDLNAKPTTPAKQKLTPEARKSAKQKPKTNVKTKSLAAAKTQSPLLAGIAGTVPGGEPYRYTLHEPASGTPKRSLILLGPWNGSSGFFDSWLLEDFRALEPETMDNYRILDAVARKIPVDAQGGGGYNAWYEYEDWHSETPVLHDVDLAVAYVHSLIEQEAEIVGYYEYVVVAGFSQGANLALEAGLRFHSPLGLVFSQRGILFEARKQDTTAVAATPYLLTAGADDHTYAVEVVQENCRWLESMSAPAYMKTMLGLDHYRRSQEECKLALKSFAVLDSNAEEDTAAFQEKQVQELSGLTDWTDCSS